MSSGFSAADAQGDFSRARRARLLADELSVSPEDGGEFLHVRLAYAATAA